MDWDARIKRAKKRGYFTETDRKRAARWTMCAVGEHRGEYERGSLSAPTDKSLTVLGIRFCDEVWRDNVSEARACWKKIQVRFRKVK